MPRFSCNGADLYYETHGEGPPLMLVAGLASDSQSWLPIIEELSRHFFVITPDNRGSGRTTPQEIETGIREIADDCVALMEHLGLSSASLAGHSMGGMVALDLAIRFPDRVDNLILAATSYHNSSRNNALFSDWASTMESGTDMKLWFRNLFYWIFTWRFFENETALKEAVDYSVDYPYPQSSIAFGNQVKAIVDFDRAHEVGGIESDTLVISGREDILFPPDVCADLAKAIPGAECTVIDQAAHSIHVEQPQAFTDRILDFLRDRK